MRLSPNAVDPATVDSFCAPAEVPGRPKALAVKPMPIPDELCDLRQWLLWKYEQRGEKWTKVPYQRNNHKAQSTNPGTWCAFGEAMNVVMRGWDGIGFVFREDGPHCGVDLDHCVRADGTLEPWAAEIVAKFGTYTETTVSGTGLHLICRGTLPAELLRGKGTGRRKGQIEVYHSGRYFTVTGHHLPESPREITDCTPQVAELLAKIATPEAKRSPKSTSTPAPAHERNGDGPSDAAILDKACASKSGAKFSRLWSGDTTDYGGDHSAADLALVSLLSFWTGPDEQRIDALFRQSGLVRDKWTEREDYRSETIGKALSGKTEFYTWRTNGRATKERKPRRVEIEPESNDAPKPLPAEAPSLRADNGRTDVANAVRFVLAYGDDVRWVGQWGKWLVWDGRRYAIDNQCRVEALAKSVATACWAWIGAHLIELEKNEATELLRWAKYTASKRGIDNMLSLARSEAGIAVTPDQLDADPWLFNSWNGIIDLKSEKLLPHDRRHLLTKLSRVEYLQGPEGECPLWEDTIDKVFSGDLDVIRFFRRLFGAAMVGDVIDHVLAILWGSGSNGKSLLSETLLSVFGDYGDKASSDLLLVKQRDSHPTEKADLFGKRLVLVSETDEGRRLSESVTKELTGGDTIHARRMREDFWSFRPQHTLVLVTNHKPRVRGNDHAMWRRLRLVPFTVQFWDRSRGETGPPDLEADSRLKVKLAREHGGILRWLVQACREWQREGLGEPERVRAATAEYRTDEDTLAEFMQECTVAIDVGRTKASDLRAEYEEWSKANGEKPVSGKRLGEYLRDSGIKKVLSNGKWYDGIMLVDR